MSPPTPGRTPGKGKRVMPYVLFNDNPRERGTLSGRAMPTNVPLNEDGFEDPAAFFRSPTVSVTDSVSRRTTIGGMSVAPSSVGTSRRVTKGRMSQLDGSDDDDMNMGYNAAGDDEEVGNDTFFGVSNPSKVPLPRRSELAPATPGTNADDLPSPSVSVSARKSAKRKSALSRSPNQTSRRSVATTVNQSPLARDLDFGDDSMLLNEDDGVTASPSSRRQSRRDTIATAAEEDEEEDEDEDTVSAANTTRIRQSLASRKSRAQDDDEEEDEEDSVSAANTTRNRQSVASRQSRVQNEDEDEDEDDEAGTAQDNDQSYEFDNGPMDDGGADQDLDLAEEDQAETEISLDGNEDGGADEDEDTGEETAVERPAPKTKKAKADEVAKTKPKPKEKRARSRQREESSGSSVSPIKRARVSGFPLLDEDDETEYTGNFKCRRSGRSHMEPLKWWIGEHVEYQPGEHLAEVREVVRLHEERRPPLAARRKTSRKPSKPTDGSGFDRNTSQFGVVWDFPTASEDENRRIAMPYDQLAPGAVKDGAFTYQKVFGEEAFAAAGVIRIPPGSSKPGKSSKDNAFFFFVHKGGLNVNVHRTSFNMGPGAMFMIPRGNKYSIENISEVEAELFFAQSRKAVLTEEEAQSMAQHIESMGSQTPGAGRSSTSKSKGTKSVEPETVQKKKAVGGKKK